MRDEIRTACKFLRDLLRLGNLLSDNELEVFRRTMEDVMKLHYQQHWFPDKPTKGSGYRCIRINHKLDPLVAKAARHCGMFDYDLLKTLFPNELTLWVDPREVSYRIGENGSICVLYDGSMNPSSEVLERYGRSCKDTMRGIMIVEPRALEQLTAYVSG